MKETKVRVKYWPSVPKCPWIVGTRQGNRYFKNESDARAFAAETELVEGNQHRSELARIEERNRNELVATERRALRDARKKATDLLRAVRHKEQKLRQEIKNLERRAAMLRAWGCLHYGYSEPPPPSVVLSKCGAGIPTCSGVYFAWRKGIIEYVGKSGSLNRRARLGHEILKQGDKISWLPIPLESLNFAEAFYIGILRPERNFNGIEQFRSYLNSLTEEESNP